MDVTVGDCHCGCGQRTQVAPYSHARLGYVKGEHYRYVRGHHPSLRTPAEQRFHAKVERREECWIWTAGQGSNGYGCFYPTPGQPVQAHRWSYAHYVEEIPAGANVLHHCDVPLCVNPDHLFSGSQAENVEDCRQKGRLGYGKRGGKSKFVGVWFDLSRSKWVATLCHRRRVITIGRFLGEEDAARHRDTYIHAHQLPHRLNFPEGT